MSLTFKKIENADVFTRDFNPLTRYNKLISPTTKKSQSFMVQMGQGKQV